MTDSRPPATLICSVMRLMPGRRTFRTTGGADPGVDLIVTRAPSSGRVLPPIPPPRSGDHTRNHYRAVAAAVLMVGLISLSATVRSTAESGPEAQPQNERSPSEPGKSPSVAAGEPSVTVLDHRDVQGILGKEVRSATDENMGRIVDIIVDRTGHVRAAVVDFGGFLGVGSRRIAIAWNALRFPANGNKVERVTLEWTRDQVREAPEYRDDMPIGMLEASSNSEPPPSFP